MKLTNRLGLPDILVKAIQNDSYSGDIASDYSTTGLLRPPRIAELSRLHRHELSEDVSDRIWALMGQVTHAIIERAAVNELVEKRLFMEIDGKTVSGQVDLWQDKYLWDWKTTSIYSGKDGPKEDWIQQGNINRLLCAKNDIEVAGIKYVALYRDWSKMVAERTKNDYPQSQVEIFDLPMWPLGVSEAFVEMRIRLHELAKENLPLCSSEERWAKPEKWALMKKGQKRAVKLYETEVAAKIAADLDSKHYVEHRPGEQTRCLFYCPVSGYCQQFRDLMEETKAKCQK